MKLSDMISDSEYPAEDAAPDEESDTDMAGEAAMSEFMSAMKKGNASAGWESFKTMMDNCMGSYKK